MKRDPNLALIVAHASQPSTSRMLGTLGSLTGDDGVERDADGVPVAFRIWRAGVNATDHGDHVFSEKSAAMILAQQSERGNRFSFDVDHMSLNDQAPPENHKSLGSHLLAVRAGELWAVDVKFNPSVRAGVTPQNPEWPSFSPAYDVDTKTGEIVRYINTALTINPATHNVTKLASVATAKETAMADESKNDEKKQETLGAMLAAYEAEPSDEKRAGMRKDILAKFAAEFPADDKKDEKKEAKKASAEEEPKKETSKAAEEPDGDEKKKESIAASIADAALIDFESKRKAREDKLEIERIVASLPAGDRELCKDMNLDQVKRVAARLNPDALKRFAAAGNVSPTRGADQTNVQGSMLPAKEREELDVTMGIVTTEPHLVKEEGTKLVFNGHATRADAERTLASIADARKNGAKKNSEAFARVLANQNGVA